MTIAELIKTMPKAELHLHIEGSFEPELMFEIANRNGIKLKYASVEELKKAYQFNNLQEFLDIYYAGASALITEKDFYELTMAYLKKASEDNIVHTEIFFDPQTHTERGISFDTVINGIWNALKDGEKKYNLSTRLIMCILRHLDAASAMETLNTALNHKDKIIAIGLDSSEVGHPPQKFAEVFAKAKAEGFLTVAHAGEEGPAEYVWGALKDLKVSRIDHGNNSLQDELLTETLKRMQMPLTLCPLSNLKLKVVKDLRQHPVRKFLEKGIVATINSDDPAYFGGYVNDNFLALHEALNLTEQEVYTLAENSFEASFIDETLKANYIQKLKNHFNLK